MRNRDEGVPMATESRVNESEDGMMSRYVVEGIVVLALRRVNPQSMRLSRMSWLAEAIKRDAKSRTSGILCAAISQYASSAQPDNPTNISKTSASAKS